MYLLDRWRKQASSDEWIEAFCDLVLEWKPMAWARRKARSVPASDLLSISAKGSAKLIAIDSSFPRAGDKAVRAHSQFAAAWLLKAYTCPSNVPWFAEFKRELLSFPAGKHDDQVDALGLIGQLLDQMVPGMKPREPAKPKIDSGYRPVGLDERHSIGWSSETMVGVSHCLLWSAS
jgi:predicted phage terminase large subunit-like protein